MMSASDDTPAALEIRTMPHPRRPNRTVRIFRDAPTAVGHLGNHVLTHPECEAWAVVCPGMADVVDVFDPDARFCYQKAAIETTGTSAQRLYDLYTAAIRSDMEDAAHPQLRWWCDVEAATIALGTSGILAIIGPRAVKSAFLPGQGDAEQVRRAREETRRSNRVLPREGGMRSGRAGRFAKREAARDRRRREARESSWSPEEKLYYRVFKPAVQFVRSKVPPQYDMQGRLVGNAYGALKEHMPRMNRLGLVEWQCLRELCRERGCDEPESISTSRLERNTPKHPGSIE